jgi:hypothetical protein
VAVEPAGGPLGPPSTDVRSFTADASGAAWIGNGCVLYARAGTAGAEPPGGPCPGAEVLVEQRDQVLRGRRVRFTAACVAAPATGCRGAVAVRGHRTGVLGRGRFEVPAGARRRLEVVLTRRGVRYVRAGLRREGDAFLAVRVRAPGGRHSREGASNAVIDRRA